MIGRVRAVKVPLTHAADVEMPPMDGLHPGKDAVPPIAG